MVQFSLVQNEHSGVGANIAPLAPKNACWQGKPGDRQAAPSLLPTIRMDASGAFAPMRHDVIAGLDTISSYAQKCGAWHFVGAMRWTRRVQSIADLPVAIGGERQDEPLLGEAWAGGKVRVSFNGTHGGLPGWGGYVGKRGGAGGIVANPDEAKEIGCYA
jgi:hypothetical protein